MSRRKNSGITILETVLGAALSMLAITAATAAFLSGASSWVRGEKEMASEGDGNRAIRIIASELREAMYVNVASDGMSIDYLVPMKDSDGEFMMPITPDGVDRSFYFDDDDLMFKEGTNERVICADVLFTDPRITTGGLGNGGVGNGKGNGGGQGGGQGKGKGSTGAPYTPFIPSPGALTREVTIKLVTESESHKEETKVSSKREVVYARNVPRIY